MAYIARSLAEWRVHTHIHTKAVRHLKRPFRRYIAKPKSDCFLNMFVYTCVCASFAPERVKLKDLIILHTLLQTY